MTPHIGKRKAKVEFGLTLRRIVLLGTPLVLTVLLFFHPSPYDDVAGKLMPIAGWWIALHAIGFLLFALMGVAVWLLTAGLRGVFATVSRVAAVVFAVFYDAGDAIAGISTGILARSAEAGTLGERAAVGAIETLWADPLKNLLFDIGRDAWIVALVTAAVALYRAGVSRLPPVLLALPAFFVTFDHAFPFGSLTFGTFFGVAAWLELAPGSASSSRQPRRVSGTAATKNLSREEHLVIGRIWHGWTRPENADEYERLLKEEIFPGIAGKNVSGYRGIQLFREPLDESKEEVEFVTIMWFDSWEAVRRFVGEDYERAYVPPKAREVLKRFDERSRHYEVKERLDY